MKTKFVSFFPLFCLSLVHTIDASNCQKTWGGRPTTTVLVFTRSSLLSLWLTDWIELWVDWETASINASIRKLRNKFRPFSSSLKKWERPSAGWARCCDGDLVFAVGLPMSKKENGPGGRRYRQTDWNRCRTDSFRRTPSTTSKMSTILSTLTRPPSHFPFNSDRLSTPKYPSISDS
jgi:hypothetical protein